MNLIPNKHELKRVIFNQFRNFWKGKREREREKFCVINVKYKEISLSKKKKKRKKVTSRSTKEFVLKNNKKEAL